MCLCLGLRFYSGPSPKVAVIEFKGSKDKVPLLQVYAGISVQPFYFQYYLKPLHVSLTKKTPDTLKKNNLTAL